MLEGKNKGEVKNMKTLYLILFSIVVSLVLVACQDNDSSTTESEQVNNDSKTTKPEQGELGSPTLPTEDDTTSSNADEKTEEESDQLKETTYKSEQEAIDSMGEIQSFEDTNLDLGHGIQAWEEGAAGHDYITWKEGNWLIQIDYPNDPEYALPTYEKGKDLATAVVDFLEENYLPAPDKVGVIRITGFNQHPETSIQWQVGNVLKEVTLQTDNPLKALEIAVNS